MTTGFDTRWPRKYAACATFGVAFSVLGVLLLNYGHLHEDAYILFQYSRNLANGQGIVFDRASGVAEGATDFLWMIALSLVSRLGVDLGTAAAVLNGLGLSALAFVVLRIRERFDVNSCLALAILVLSGGTAASFGGFSSLAYGGVFALLLLSALEGKYKAMTAYAVLLALFRPDGVLLAFATLLFVFLGEKRERRRELIVLLAAATCVGVLYFAWRLDYFGMWLPLPLLVKSQTSKLLQGLRPNYNAIRTYLPLLLPLAYLVIRRKTIAINWHAFLTLGAGAVLLFLALSFARQSQNVGYRFQFPIIIAMTLTYLLAIDQTKGHGRLISVLFLAVPLLALVHGAKLLRKEVKYLTNGDYINSFPQYLRASRFRADNIALTEAGRFPYWFDATKITDLVGLNSPDVVANGAAAILAKHNPQLLFVHQTGQYNTSAFWSGVNYEVKESRDISVRGPYSGRNPVQIAPHAALVYAQKNDFLAILVRYGERDSEFHHVYFLSRTLNLERFMEALERSFKERTSYYVSEALTRSFRINP